MAVPNSDHEKETYDEQASCLDYGRPDRHWPGDTQSAALEGATANVRVNAVAPGPIETELLNRFTGSERVKAGLVATVPLKRAGLPEEIAQTILFLASDKASFITGQVVTVDGGKTAG